MSEEKEKEFELNTKKSLYDPIKIKIDGQVYPCAKMTHTFLDELNKLDKDVIVKKDKALYEIVRLMFNVDAEILEVLDRREVEDIYLYTKRELAKIDQERLKIVTSSFKNILSPEGQKATRVIPKNPKRSGKKR